jgi:hypothetical protein
MVQKSTSSSSSSSSSCRWHYTQFHFETRPDPTAPSISRLVSSRLVPGTAANCNRLLDSLFYSLPPPHPVALSRQYSSISFHSMQKYSSQHAWSFKSIGRFTRHRATPVRMYVYACPFLVCSHGDIGTHGRHVLRAPRAMDPEIARPSSQAKAFISVFPWSDICIYRGNTTILDDRP